MKVKSTHTTKDIGYGKTILQSLNVTRVCCRDKSVQDAILLWCFVVDIRELGKQVEERNIMWHLLPDANTMKYFIARYRLLNITVNF